MPVMKSNRLPALLLILATVHWAPRRSVGAPSAEDRVYVGTYTGAASKGVYAFDFDAATGRATSPELAAETPNPTFLTSHPNHRFLYAANEIGNFGGKKSGAVSAFAIDAASGHLKLLNQQPSGGDGPCHVSLDPSGRWALVANYGSGSVAVFPVRADGRLGEATAVVQHEGRSVNPRRQEGPHAHFITMDPAGRFALACDLGLDQVLVYRFDAGRGALAANDPPAARLKPGSGPRHLAFHPNGRFAYVISEMASTITAFRWQPGRGALAELPSVSTLPVGFAGQSTAAEIQVHPSGKFVYGSNRGDDSIAVFATDPRTAKLAFVERQSTLGRTPRYFGLDPTGRFLLACNQDSGNIVVFRVEGATGRLTPTGQTLTVGSPVCLQFVPMTNSSARR